MKKVAARGVGYGDRSTYTDASINYTPTGGITTIKTMSDMKFPENIKFFIETIIKWLKNLIAFALKAIKNLIKIICGAEVDKDELKEAKEKLHVEFKKTKTYHAVGTPIISSKPGQVEMRVLNQNELQRIGITESALLEDDKKDNALSGPVVISIDMSKDVLALKEFMNHFFKLYDNAFGSNEEFLFGTEDVELLLKAFNTVRENLESGNTTFYSIAGRAMEVDMIDADRMRDAAYKTKVNVDALSKAYSDTFARIQDILKVIQSKSLMQSVNSVTSFKILSHATAGVALDLLNALEPRIKEATILEKRLDKVQNMYEKLIKALQKNMGVIGAFGKVTYVSQYQNQVTNLFNSARYTSQIISMRISALALYLKEMKDLKEMLKILTNFSSR
jgi:hypothetical protein